MTKEQLLALQKYKCFYCGVKIDIFTGEKDHVNPQNRTWASSEKYIPVKMEKVMACGWCNSSKWAYPPIIWRNRLKAVIEDMNREVRKRKNIIKKLDWLLDIPL